MYILYIYISMYIYTYMDDTYNTYTQRLCIYLYIQQICINTTYVRVLYICIYIYVYTRFSILIFLIYIYIYTHPYDFIFACMFECISAFTQIPEHLPNNNSYCSVSDFDFKSAEVLRPLSPAATTIVALSAVVGLTSCDALMQTQKWIEM